MSGEYLGVPLICDKVKTKKTKNVQWLPSRYYIYLFWSVHSHLLKDKYEWSKFFAQPFSNYSYDTLIKYFEKIEIFKKKEKSKQN